MQGIGRNDQVKPGTGWRGSFAIHKIGYFFTLDAGTAGAAFTIPSPSRRRFLECSFLAIGLQPFSGGEAALARVRKNQFPAAITECDVGSGPLDQNIGKAAGLRHHKACTQECTATIFCLPAGEAQDGGSQGKYNCAGQWQLRNDVLCAWQPGHMIRNVNYYFQALAQDSKRPSFETKWHQHDAEQCKGHNRETDYGDSQSIGQNTIGRQAAEVIGCRDGRKTSCNKRC